MALVLAIPVLR
ncbi:hypothetical protein LINPERHAP1_LOCUS26671 [Linum perenne]